MTAEILVTGVVQGVGFRPFCVRTAKALGLRGTVRNTPEGVEIVLEGGASVIDEFIRALWEDHPDAAVVADVQVRRAPEARAGFPDFSVLASARPGEREGGERQVLIPADLAVCGNCLAEMRDPQNRRYRYPFINCTNCGPRYTIIRALPYDRPRTTMADFLMCPACQREYDDPADRRCHAQPNACPVCGPRVRLCDITGRALCEGEEAIQRLTGALAAGKIAAIKGIGGFHLACLPEDAPLRELRRRKHRPDKPFALMVREPEDVVEASGEARRLMAGVQRPIALCPARPGSRLSPLVAPGQKSLGVMLPYTPLHHLIMEKFPVLVMTSANVSDAPIVSTDGEAFSALAGIADLVLTHNRDIHTAIDDSVLIPGNPASPRPIFLRRARGYVPNPVALPPSVRNSGAPDILAAGAQMKSTYALTRGGVLFPGQYLGDLDRLETASYYERSLRHFIGLYGIEPEVLAFDKHPGYAAAELAMPFFKNEPVLRPVQHHHAHLASVLLDNASFDPAIGVIFDGTGYGDDGTIWGGEFLVGDAKGFTRAGSLRPARLPGGERAIREPWRCALAFLREALGAEEAGKTAASLWPQYRHLVAPVLSVLEQSPVTTSCGRLFDAFSALLGLCPSATYDGQAAMELESAADFGYEDALPFGLEEQNGFVLLDWREALKGAAAAFGPDAAVRARASAAFHRGLARAAAEVCVLLRERTGIGRAALSGGVWQNTALLGLACGELRRRGFAVLTHRNLSPNDEGVSPGQALAAACAD